MNRCNNILALCGESDARQIFSFRSCFFNLLTIFAMYCAGTLPVPSVTFTDILENIKAACYGWPLLFLSLTNLHLSFFGQNLQSAERCINAEFYFLLQEDIAADGRHGQARRHCFNSTYFLTSNSSVMYEVPKECQCPNCGHCFSSPVEVVEVDTPDGLWGKVGRFVFLLGVSALWVAVLMQFALFSNL